jgi:hypothetical protein
MADDKSVIPEFRLPDASHRVGIFGRTGTGKTRKGVWVLSWAPFDKVPYVVLDYKLERLFSRIDRVREIGLDEKPPKAPGLYIARPSPNDDDAVEAWLWNIHERENCGVYVDEGYGIDAKSKALRAVLTQGRSKRLPCIFLSQRPSWISPFVVSEADFLDVFQLTLPQDVQKVSEIMGRENAILSQSLPEYHSLWFDVAKNRARIMTPVPDDETILDRIDQRLKPRRKAI